MDKHRKFEEYKIKIQSNVENFCDSNLEEIQDQGSIEIPNKNINEEKTCDQIKLQGM